MKTDTGALAVSLVLTSFLAASSADAQQRETRPLEGFDAIEVGGGIDLFLRQGQSFVVEVEAEDGDAAEIVTEVRDRTLEIRRKSSFNFFSWDGDPGAVHVTLPALVSLTASGGSDVRTEGAFTSDNLQIVASGGSDLVMTVSATTLEAQASGGSDMRLSGTVRSASVRSSGGSDLNASGLTADGSRRRKQWRLRSLDRGARQDRRQRVGRQRHRVQRAADRRRRRHERRGRRSPPLAASRKRGGSFEPPPPGPAAARPSPNASRTERSSRHRTHATGRRRRSRSPTRSACRSRR